LSPPPPQQQQQQHISFSDHVSVINDERQQDSPLSAPPEDDLSYIDDDRNQYGDLLTMTSFRRWDYPVFELSDVCPDTLLSRVRFVECLRSNNATNKFNMSMFWFKVIPRFHNEACSSSQLVELAGPAPD